MNADRQITKNFRSSEFSCPCCGAAAIHPELVYELQRLRNIVGAPIYVTSGYRCVRHNAVVGGVPDSYHLQGLAADIWCEKFSPPQLMMIAEQVTGFNEGGIGEYPSHIHVDVRENGPARWFGW
jgi:uncharacterized protein YcbK (DUF882 family)